MAEQATRMSVRDSSVVVIQCCIACRQMRIEQQQAFHNQDNKFISRTYCVIMIGRIIPSDRREMRTPPLRPNPARCVPDDVEPRWAPCWSSPGGPGYLRNRPYLKKTFVTDKLSGKLNRADWMQDKRFFLPTLKLSAGFQQGK